MVSLDQFCRHCRPAVFCMARLARRRADSSAAACFSITFRLPLRQASGVHGGCAYTLPQGKGNACMGLYQSVVRPLLFRLDAERAHHLALAAAGVAAPFAGTRSEEHTSELQSLMRTSYAVFCLKK